MTFLILGKTRFSVLSDTVVERPLLRSLCPLVTLKDVYACLCVCDSVTEATPDKEQDEFEYSDEDTRKERN